MHIEISAGGLSGFVSVHSYQSSMKRYISDADKIISSFKAVQNSTRNITNGVGNLSGALSDITTRVRNEEIRKSDAEFIQRESTSFLDLARQVDERVAARVNQNREQFYRDYPHLRPSFFHDAKKFFGDVWDWLRSATKNVADVIRTIKSSIGEFVAKIVKSNVFTKIAATIALVALAALAIFSFPAILAAAGIAGVTATILTAVFAVSTAIGAILNVYSVWGNIAEHPVLQKIQIIANTLSFGMVLVLTLGTGGTVVSTVYAVSKIVTEVTNVIDAFVVIDDEFYVFLKDVALIISTVTGIYLTGEKVIDKIKSRKRNVSDNGTGKKYTGNRTEDEYEDLAKDPDHNFEPTPGSLEERDVALGLEKNGKVGHVERGPKGTDFVDTTNGKYWDVKSFRSSPAGSTSAKGAFRLEKAMGQIKGEISKGINVMINTTHMTDEHILQLQNCIHENNLDDYVLWYPE